MSATLFDMDIEEIRELEEKMYNKNKDMPDFSLCDTEEKVQELNDLIDNLW